MVLARKLGIVLLISLLLVELLLRFVDPIGIFTYYEDSRILSR
ncbi:MAG: hypothetical protein AAFU54_30050 [Chloroflexota bacterium]